MNKSIHSIRALLVAALVAVPALAVAPQGPAPKFTLASMAGPTVNLDQYKGQVVMINFWASWCGPCRQEMPLLDQLYQQYADLGFALLGVNVEENPADAERMLKDTPVTFPILFDAENTVSQLYDVTAMPSTVIVDRDGNVRFVHKGYQPGYEDEYQTQVRALVRE